jgi:hypothetical protein
MNMPGTRIQIQDPGSEDTKKPNKKGKTLIIVPHDPPVA